MDAASQFVRSLHTLLEGDPLTASYLLPLDSLTSSSYRERFRMRGEPQYVVREHDTETWMTPLEFYVRSRRSAIQLSKYVPSEVIRGSVDVPTGGVSQERVAGSWS